MASKVIDEFMKTEGHTYLHRTLQPCVDEVGMAVDMTAPLYHICYQNKIGVAH